jgi:tRNA threonylcarbamoyl adenosine modification protein YeaZ
MTALLAIDCAFPEALIALRLGERIFSRSFGPQRSHALRMIDELQALFDEAEIVPSQLSRIGVGQGPGSFTGLRVALASAGGLAQASDAELVGFSTFDALPLAQDIVFVAFDARSDVVYCGLREGEHWLVEVRPRPIEEAVVLAARAGSFYGNSAARYPQLANGLTVIDVEHHIVAERALNLSAAATFGGLVLPTYKEGAQAQNLFGSPDLGRALDGDELI